MVILNEFITRKLRQYLSEGIDNSIVLYHGTNNKFTVFNDSKPIFFVDDVNVAKTHGGILFKVRLNMDNPIELDFNGRSTYYFNGRSTYYFIDKWYLPSELANKIKEISNDIRDRYDIGEELKDYLESLGFSDSYGDLDGVIMYNISDAMGGVFSTHEPANNYVVFNKDQITILN